MSSLVEMREIIFQRDDFCLRVDRLDLLAGQLYLLTGPNGAGKSTLLQLLAQILEPHQGVIRFAGEPVTSSRQRQKIRRQVTLVDQHPFLFAGTVELNLAFGLRLRDLRGDLQRRRIHNALQRVGLPDFAPRRSDSLSGGEIQRVALARALVLQPRMLLLDEASSGMDRETLPLFEELLSELSHQGTTVLLSSHDQHQPHRLQAQTLTIHNGILCPPQTNIKIKEEPCHAARI